MREGDFPNEVELIELNRNMTVRIGKWKPPQRPQWVKEVMKTPGYIRVQISLLTILMISSVSSTVLQITRMGENISVENISGSLELLEVKKKSKI